MMPMRNLVLRLRRSLLLESINFRVKSLFSSHKEKYARRLLWLQLIRQQSKKAFLVQEPQIFIDISVLVCSDNQTGIHRLVRSVATCVSRMKYHKGYRLSLVYASKYRTGYWHAFQYERRTLGREGLPEEDQAIGFKKGDIFFELDWNMKLAPIQRPFYERMVAAGVHVFFNVYDIIPLQLHDLYSAKSQRAFEKWLLEASRYTGVLCNSQAAADDYREWRQKKGLSADFIIRWFHLGADIENSHPSTGLPDNAREVLEAMGAGPSILMVSALHPRKCYAQALEAFELLWNAGHDVMLVIAGKDDPYSGGMGQRLREHPEQGRRLVWLDNISDEYLRLVYEACSAVLFASRAEGFGLAVWEGARYGKPLILRDLPVFRELAGENALYFSGLDPRDLAEGIERWMRLREDGMVRNSTAIPIQTWEESTRRMLEQLVQPAGAQALPKSRPGDTASGRG